MFDNIIAKTQEAVNTVANQAQKMILEQLQGISLDPQLKGLENAQKLIVLPFASVPCCKQPYYYYKLVEDLRDKAPVLGYIMHGRQNEVPRKCCDLCKDCLKAQCGAKCGAQCEMCLRQCGIFCSCFCKCLTCQQLFGCCRSFKAWISEVPNFSTYENVLEINHKITALGRPISEKDGLYIGKTEFANGTQYQNPNEIYIDPVFSDGLVYDIVQKDPVKQKELEDLEFRDLQGFPKMENKEEIDVYSCIACLFYGQNYESYKANHIDISTLLNQYYAVNYKGQYLGRYIRGQQYRLLMQYFCPCVGNLDGYGFKDDVYLLDSQDVLIFRITQVELGCLEACMDSEKKLYKMEIKTPDQKVVGTVTKQLEKKCFGLCRRWIFTLNFPQKCTPVQKLLLTYLIPYLNLNEFNVWNDPSGDDLHNQLLLNNDVSYLPIDRGINELVTEKLVNVMSYKQQNMTDVTQILASCIMNPTRSEGDAIKIQSYTQSKALLREFARRKRMVERQKIVDRYVLQHLQKEDKELNKNR